MTGQQLKNSILQMAVQGKLVPQDPNDEPASVLLERIRAEKEQLIKEGKIKKEKNPSVIFRGADNLPYEKVGKNEPVCIADEVPFDIPESWEWVRLGTISTYAETKKKINAQDADPNLWGLDLEDIEKGGQLISQKTVGERKAVGDKTIFKCGDILYSKLRPYLLKILVAPNNGICTPEIVPFNLYGKVNAYYIVEFLKSPYVDQVINSVTYGVKMPRVGTEAMTSLLVPLPPISEQARIITKLRCVLPEVQSYNTAYEKGEKLTTEFPIQLKKSILQYAVQGKLIPQDPADEPASALLERIRAEKEQLIKEGKIKRDKHESVIFRRDNSYYEISGKNEVCIDDQIPFDVPESWEWTRLGNVLASTDAGKSPQCEDRSCNKGEAGVIKTTAVQDGYFLPNENKILPTSFTIQKDQLIRKGDLLITRAGPRNRTGVLCVVDVECEKLILSDKTVRLAYIRNNVNPHYLQIALSSPAIQNMVVKAMSGMAESQVNISQSNMKKFLIPIPPLNEQNRIVDKYKTVYSAFVNKFEFLL